MLRRLAILGLTAAALTGCGGGGSSDTSSTTAAETTTAEAKPDAIAFRTFFFRDGALVPMTTLVPATKAVARAALVQLLAGSEQPGYDTAIPRGVQLDDVAIENGVATASFSARLGSPTRSAQGQIVSTLSQFPSVRGVRLEVDGKPVPLQDGSGDDLTRPATGSDYTDLTPDALIFVRTPARDATVSSPVDVEGTATVFEATLRLEIWSGGKLVGTKTITASNGAPERGTWSQQLTLPKGDVRLLLYEPSAEDGSHLHETEVLLHVQ